MPSKVLILNAIGIILQYSLVALLYYFLFKVARLIYADIAGFSLKPQFSFASSTKPQDTLPEAKLTVVDKGQIPLAQTVYPLGETISIGRSEGNGIVINDSFVSNEHACIARDKNGFWLTDLQSTNGTYLNNRQVAEEVLLQKGDLLKIGEVIFRFER